MISLKTSSLLLVTTAAFAGRASAAARTFVNIFETNAGAASGTPSYFGGGAAINNAGVLAFSGSGFRTATNSFVEGVYTARVSAPGTIATVYAPDFFVTTPSLSDNGKIAMNGGDAGGGGGSIYTASVAGGPVVHAYAPGQYGVENGYGIPAVNNAGQVAVFANGGSGLFGEAAGTVAGGPITLLTNVPEFNGAAGEPTINNNGRIVFSSTRQGVGDGLFTVSAAGGSVAPIRVDATNYTFLYNAQINDNDRVAYLELTFAGGTSEEAVYTSALDGTRTLVADTTGGYQSFGGGGPTGDSGLAFGDGGAVAFFAQLDDAGGLAGATGLFTGPDPVRDKLIATGDTLFGGTVTALTLDGEGVNADGTIAFSYRLLRPGDTIETYGVAVALVPEPATLAALVGVGLAGGRWRRRGPCVV